MKMDGSESRTELGQSSSKKHQCRQELLDGIATLPKIDTPGRIVVFGDNSTPILSGTTQRDVLLACSELGKGRIVVVGHDGYMGDIAGLPKEDSIARLHLNMKKWVSNQQMTNGSEMLVFKKAHDVSRIEGCKVIVWHGGSLPDDATEKVMNFVMNGGGLLYAMCPWGWLQLNPGKTLSDMPLYRVLKKAGLCYTGKYLRNDSQSFQIADALNVNGGFHLGCALDNSVELGIWDTDVPDVLSHLSSTAINSLRIKLERMVNTFRVELSSCTSCESNPAKKTMICFCKILAEKNIQSDTSKECREELLEGITTLPKIGTPGRVVVFGDDATPVLSGDTPGDVLLACAKLGRGRIVVIGHNGYMEDIAGLPKEDSIARLHLNMKKWVSNQQMTNGSEMLVLKKAHDVSRIEGCKVVVWHGGSLPDDATEKAMNFVMNGGGLLYAMCPWGWLQLNPGKTLSDMPLYSILEKAGMCYSSDYLQNHFNRFDVLDGTGGLHLGHALDEILKLDVWHEAVPDALRQLSPYGIKILRNRLEKIPIRHCDKLNSCAPSKSKPVTDPKEKAITGVCEFLCANNVGMHKAPSIETFPGDFESLPDLQCAELKFDSKHDDFHPTGFYLPAGVDMTVRVLAKVGGGSWKIRIGAHTDILNRVKKLTRWPNVSCEKELPTHGQTTVFSPFGGLVYFVSPNGETKLEVTLDNVVESPVFDLRDPCSKSEWQTRRYAPGLWADISGRLITMTLPSKSVRDIENPWEVMEIWDEVVQAHHELRGTLPSERRREFVVCDQQPSAGYMHSGHPIVTHLDVAEPSCTDMFLLDHHALRKKGSWGLFHEIGHNMQRPWWTFDGTGEVTCNIFTLHAMETICGINPWIHPWLANSLVKIKGYLNEGAIFAKWKSNPGIALGIYAQLAHHFGWNAYKAVFRKYEGLGSSARPNGNHEKIDFWIGCFSEAVGRNLCPLFQFWGLPISDKLKGKLKIYPAWFPDDEMTGFAPERVSLIKESYPDIKA